MIVLGVLLIIRSLLEDLVEQRRLNAALQAEIAERKRVERELRIKEAAIATSTNAIGLADMEDLLSYANDALLNMWGYADRSEVLGRRTITFWRSESEATRVGRALRRDGAWFGERWFVMPNPVYGSWTRSIPSTISWSSISTVS